MDVVLLILKRIWGDVKICIRTGICAANARHSILGGHRFAKDLCTCLYTTDCCIEDLRMQSHHIVSCLFV